MDSDERAAAYANIVIGIATFYICWTLHFAETWPHFAEGIRDFLTAYNMYCLSSAALQSGTFELERVNIRLTPWDWQPTLLPPRDWAANPFEGIDNEAIFGAMLPGFMFFALFSITTFPLSWHNLPSTIWSNHQHIIGTFSSWVRRWSLVLFLVYHLVMV